MSNVDYTEVIRQSAATCRWRTACGIAPEDMDSLTHQLRYQAGKLGFDVSTSTDKKKGTVSFIAFQKGTDT
jgi:hypothetical protein